MKKKIGYVTILLSLALTLALLARPTTEVKAESVVAPETGVVGDANKDKDVDVRDLVCMLKYIQSSDTESISSDADLDFNGDVCKKSGNDIDNDKEYLYKKLLGLYEAEVTSAEIGRYDEYVKGQTGDWGTTTLKFTEAQKTLAEKAEAATAERTITMDGVSPTLTQDVEKFDSTEGEFTLNKDRFKDADTVVKNTVAVTYTDADGGTVKVLAFDVDVYTMVIDSVAEMNKMPMVINFKNGAGYYVLGGDVKYGPDESYNSYEDIIRPGKNFKGTFDGRGYTIDSLKTYKDSVNLSRTHGIFGSTVSNKADGTAAVIKNVSFTNARHYNAGGFLFSNTSAGAVKLENLYIEISVFVSAPEDKISGVLNPTSNANINAPSALISNGSNTTIKDVFIKYVTSDSDSPNDICINPDQVSTDDLESLGVTEKNFGYPIRNYAGGKTSLQGLYVIGADKIAVAANYLTSLTSLPGSYGAYTTSDEEELKYRGVQQKDTDLPNVGIAMGDSDGSSVVTEQASLVKVTLGGKQLTSTYKENKLSLNRSELGDLGEKTVVANFIDGDKLVEVSIPIDVCTYLIENSDDLMKMPGVIRENGGAGRYILGKDITCGEDDSYSSNVDLVSEGIIFTGTFDGHGCKIINLKTEKSRTVSNTHRGIFGQYVGDAVIKNVHFVNARHYNMGGFLFSATQSGTPTLENLCVEICMLLEADSVNVNKILDTFGRGARPTALVCNAGKTKITNVRVEYVSASEDDKPYTQLLNPVWNSGQKYGYPMNIHNLENNSINGLYVIGADKIAYEGAAGKDLANSEENNLYHVYSNIAEFEQANPNWKLIPTENN